MRSDCYIVFLILLLPLSCVGQEYSVSLSGSWKTADWSFSPGLQTNLCAEQFQSFDYFSSYPTTRVAGEPNDELIRSLSGYFQQRTGSFAWLILGGVFIALSWWMYQRYQQLVGRQNALINEVNVLREQVLAQSSSRLVQASSPEVDRTKVEQAIDGRLGESAWRIINLVLENPAISNKELASEVNLSLDGVSSALRRIYAAFGVKGKGNKKVLLSRKILQIHTGIDEENNEQ